MPEGVTQPCAAGAKGLLDHIPVNRRASVASSSDSGVDVVNLEHQTDRRTSCRLGSNLSFTRELVCHVNTAATKAKLGVADLAVGHRQPVILDCSQPRDVERESGRCVRDDQVGDDTIDDARCVWHGGHSQLRELIMSIARDGRSPTAASEADAKPDISREGCSPRPSLGVVPRLCDEVSELVVISRTGVQKATAPQVPHGPQSGTSST